MGHYRSEMGFEEDDKREADARAERRANILAGVVEQIRTEGIENVLADLIEELQESRVYVARQWATRGYFIRKGETR